MDMELVAATLFHSQLIWVDTLNVYVPDLPGHGQSDHESRPLTILELTEALGRWMDACELKSAVLVGHSLGCQIAVELAVQRPDLASALLLIGPTADPKARSSVRHIARGLRTSLYERPTGSVWLTLDYKRAGFRVLGRELRDMVSHWIEDRLPQVAIPVRVVRGERDRVVPQDWAEALARMVGAPEPKVIPKWGHAVHYDDPEAVAQITLDFAESVVAAQKTTSGVNELTV